MKAQQKKFLIGKENFSYQQKLPSLKNYVFEGGGVKGVVYLGALRAFEERGLLQHIQRAAGSSVGAFPAILLSMGLHAEEIKEIADETNFIKLLDPFLDTDKNMSHDCRMICGVNNLVSLYLMRKKSRYAFHGNDLLARMQDIIAGVIRKQAESYPEIYEAVPAERLADPRTANITFADLDRIKAVLNLHEELEHKVHDEVYAGNDFIYKSQETDNGDDSKETDEGQINWAVNDDTYQRRRPRYCESIITGTNKDTGQTEFFCGRFTPDMPVADAMRASMALPIVFEDFKLKQDGQEEKIIIDGGMSLNFMLEKFSCPPIGIPEIDSLDVPFDRNIATVGFSLSPEDLLQLPNVDSGILPSRFDNFVAHLAPNVEYLRSEEENRRMKYENPHLIARLDPLGVHTTDFDISDAMKTELIKSGYNGAVKYIKNYYQNAGFYVSGDDLVTIMKRLYMPFVAQLCADIREDRIEFEFEMKLSEEQIHDVKKEFQEIAEQFYLAVRTINDRCNLKDVQCEKNIFPNGKTVLKAYGEVAESICPIAYIIELYNPYPDLYEDGNPRSISSVDDTKEFCFTKLFGPGKDPYFDIERLTERSYKLFRALRGQDLGDYIDSVRARNKISDTISEIVLAARQYLEYLDSCFSLDNIKSRRKFIRSMISQLLTIKKTGFTYSIEIYIQEVLARYQHFLKEGSIIFDIHSLYFFQRRVADQSREFLTKIDLLMSSIQEEIPGLRQQGIHL